MRKPLRWGSVCTGLSAESAAWLPLGWEPVWFSEIDPFPCAVLAHHYPNVPNLGDMLKFYQWKKTVYAAIDILSGGTPCPGFSIAGLRGGLDDPRSKLSLTYIDIAAYYRTRWLVWENVCGVFSSGGGKDFAQFLAGLTGRNIEVPREGWGDSGIIQGIPDAYGVAWRTLDAQYIRVDGFPRAIPQRRKRIFLVGYLGDWRRAAAVLFESAGLRGDPPPCRKAKQDVAPTLESRINGGGFSTEAVASGAAVVSGTLKTSSARRSADGAECGTLVAGCLQRNGKAAGSATNQDAENGLLVAQTLTTGGDSKKSNRKATSNDKMTLVPAVAWALQERDSRGADSNTKVGHLLPEVSAPLTGAPYADTEGRETKLIASFDETQVTSKANRSSCKPDSCHSLAKGARPPAIAFAIQERAISENPLAGPDGIGINDEGAAYTLESRPVPQAVAFRAAGQDGFTPDTICPPIAATDGGGAGVPCIAFPANMSATQHATSEEVSPVIQADNPTAVAIQNTRAGHDDQNGLGISSGGSAYTLDTTGAQGVAYPYDGMEVRRLTPKECERLMGHPDDFTAIIRRGKIVKDGPRYKATGNGECINAVRWIGMRIQAVEDQINGY